MRFETFGFNREPARTEGGSTYSTDPDGSRMREEWRQHADAARPGGEPGAKEPGERR